MLRYCVILSWLYFPFLVNVFPHSWDWLGGPQVCVCVCACVCIFLTLFRQDIRSQAGIESQVQNPGFSLAVGYPRETSVWPHPSPEPLPPSATKKRDPPSWPYTADLPTVEIPLVTVWTFFWCVCVTLHPLGLFLRCCLFPFFFPVLLEPLPACGSHVWGVFWQFFASHVLILHCFGFTASNLLVWSCDPDFVIWYCCVYWLRWDIMSKIPTVEPAKVDSTKRGLISSALRGMTTITTWKIEW